MRGIAIHSAVIVFLLLPLKSPAQPGFPNTFSYQGFVSRPDGTRLDTAGVDVTLKLYEKVGSESVVRWEETHNGVNVVGGVFDVRVGTETPLDAIPFKNHMHLGISLGDLPEFGHRTLLDSAPFALGMRGMYAVWVDNGDTQGYTIVGGTPVNEATSGIVGATISGGGGVYSGGGSLLANKVSNNYATVGGGTGNVATGGASTIAGGDFNAAGGGTGAGGGATVGGGTSNDASGLAATIPGGYDNRAAGDYSFAAGSGAKADHRSAFVWSDHQDPATVGNFTSTDVNQFLIRASGGVGIGTDEPFEQLTVVDRIAVTALSTGDEGGQISLMDGDGDGAWEIDNFGNTSNEQFRLFRDRGFDDRINVLTVDVDGEVGINTAAPAAPLDVYGGHANLSTTEGDLRIGTGIYRLKIGVDISGDEAGTSRIRSQGGDNLLYMGSGTTDVLAINHPEGVWPLSDNIYDLGKSGKKWRGIHLGSGGVYQTSDGRAKAKVTELRYGLDEVLRLRPVSFVWKDQANDERIGLIAQEVTGIIPEIVRGNTDEELLSMSYAELVPVLVRAIQEQQAQIAALRRLVLEQK